MRVLRDSITQTSSEDSPGIPGLDGFYQEVLALKTAYCNCMEKDLDATKAELLSQTMTLNSELKKGMRQRLMKIILF
jgi:hypothetical protein